MTSEAISPSYSTGVISDKLRPSHKSVSLKINDTSLKYVVRNYYSDVLLVFSLIRKYVPFERTRCNNFVVKGTTHWFMHLSKIV